MELFINPTSFDLIEKGQKTVETRLGDDSVLSKVKVGDELVITNREDHRRLTKRVTGVHRYLSSEDVVANESLKTLGDYESAEAYLTRMAQFQSAADEEQYGIIAVKLG